MKDGEISQLGHTITHADESDESADTASDEPGVIYEGDPPK